MYIQRHSRKVGKLGPSTTDGFFFTPFVPPPKEPPRPMGETQGRALATKKEEEEEEE